MKSENKKQRSQKRRREICVCAHLTQTQDALEKCAEMRISMSKELKGYQEFLKEEEGMGTVEIILIILVLVGLVVIFKNQITRIVDNIFNKITAQTGKI